MALTDNLISHYKLDESSGNAADSVGSNTLTNTNVTYGAGKLGNGAIFNGTSSKFTLPNGSAPTGSSARTISLWFNNNTTTAETLFGYGINSSAGTAFLIHANINAGGIYLGTAGSNDGYTAGGLFTTGSWVHVVITYLGGALNSTNLKIYVNGASRTLTFSGSSPLATVDSNYSIGYDTPYATRYYSGMIDEVSIWSRALSADEVSQLFNSGRANAYPFTATPSLYGGVAYYKLDESSGNAADSISSNTLINTGTVTYTAAKINNGATNNGTSGKYLRVGSSLGWTSGGSFTINGWFNMSSFTSGYLLRHRCISTAERNNILYNNGTGVTAFFSGNEVTSGSLSTATWYMFTMTISSGGTSEFFINGISKGTTTMSTNGGGGVAYFCLLNDDTGTTPCSNGTLDEVGTWDRVLSSTEISTLYNAGAALAYPWTTTSTPANRNFFML